jgi:hypothetical protein
MLRKPTLSRPLCALAALRYIGITCFASLNSLCFNLKHLTPLHFIPLLVRSLRSLPFKQDDSCCCAARYTRSGCRYAPKASLPFGTIVASLLGYAARGIEKESNLSFQYYHSPI